MTMLFRRALLLAISVSSGLAGCASRSSGDDASVGSGDATTSARIAPATSDAVPPPPGIAAAVRARAPEDERARVDLDTVLAQFAASLPEPGPPPPAVDSTQQDEALRHYIQGRDEALRGRHLVAVTRLEKAREFDPYAPRILRELAHSYAAIPNPPRAVSLFRDLLVVDPYDSEALLTLALAAVNRRVFEEGVAYVARARANGGRFTHDPGADLVANYALYTALVALGYQRAAIEAGLAAADVDFPLGEQTNYRHGIAVVYRRRGEIWREIGDAHCRLGEFPPARAAYERAKTLPSADPVALHARIIYADLRMGRPEAAQATLVADLYGSAPVISDRSIALCEYLVEHLPDPDGFTEVVVGLAHRYPDEPGFARAAALILPPVAANRLLRDFVARRPRDSAVVGQLLAWIGRRDPGAARDLAAAFASDVPDLADDYAARLLLAVSHASVLLDSPSPPATPSDALILARVRLRLADLGGAWSVCRAGLERWPDDSSLRLLQIDVAARLDEPRLLASAIAEAETLDTARSWVVRSAAYREAERFQDAVAAAGRARDAADRDGEDLLEALLEMGRVLAAQSSEMTGVTRAETLDAAARLADEARMLAPTDERPYAFLADVSVRGDAPADRERLREVREHVRRTIPASRFAARFQVDHDLVRDRYERALEGAVGLFEGDPTDAESLALAMLAWRRLTRLEEAERWLWERLEPSGGEPTVIDQLVRFLLAQDRADKAREVLESRLSAGDDPAARRLLELVDMVEGNTESAIELGERRLFARPEGTRRALQLAVLYAQGGARGGRVDDAIEQIDWIAAHPESASQRHLAGALALVNSISGDEERLRQLRADLVANTVAAFPESPLPLYASGLMASADTAASDPRFARLAMLAATRSEGSDDGSIRGVLPWRALAQRLIDLGHTEAAVQVLEARLAASFDGAVTLEPRALRALVSMTLAAEVAASGDPQHIVDLLVDLNERGVIPALPGQEGDPTLAGALSSASQLFSLIGDDAGSEMLLRESVRLDPTDAMTMNNLGYIRVEAGHDDDQTIGWIEEAISLAPDEASILDTVAWLRYKQGQLTDADDGPGAITWLERAVVAMTDPSAEVFDHYGDAMYRLGSTDEAVRHWRNAERLLSDESRRDRIRQDYERVQRERWGLLVADPVVMYDREFGALLERTRRKIAAVEAGSTPETAQTFVELARPE